MAILDILPNIVADPRWNMVIWSSIGYILIIIFIVIIWIVTSKKKKGVDVSALAALASSDSMAEDAAPNADPKEVMAILQIERVAASSALSAVNNAQKSKRISSSISDSLTNRYKARIAKIDADLKRRSGVQEYQSLAESLEQSRDKLRDEVMPGVTTPPPIRTPSIPPPPTSSTPGIPPTAPPVPGSTGPRSTPPLSYPTTAPPTIPPLPSLPTTGTPPTKPASPIPIPPKIPPISPTTRPSTVVPPSIAPPTISTPPIPPRVPTSTPITPPTTTNMAPPPVPTSIPTTPEPPTDADTQSISGLRMEMLRELARLKKFMSEETQQ